MHADIENKVSRKEVQCKYLWKENVPEINSLLIYRTFYKSISLCSFVSRLLIKLWLLMDIYTKYYILIFFL